VTAADIVILLLGVVAVGSGVLVVSTRQLVHAALWLDSGNRTVALVVAVATAAVLVTTLVRGFHDAYFPLKARVGSGSTGALGASLFRTWVLPFEALSVLLLAALVGAIVLSRSDIGPGSAEEDPEPRKRPRTGGPLVRRRKAGTDDEDTIVLSRIDEGV
jgi:NADH-quinone oxidoreductase subunit J